MEPNRTSSFPAAIKKTTLAVTLSVGMTLLTLALSISTFATGSHAAGLILAGLTVGQLFLLSMNVVAKHQIDKKNKSAGP